MKIARSPSVSFAAPVVESESTSLQTAAGVVGLAPREEKLQPAWAPVADVGKSATERMRALEAAIGRMSDIVHAFPVGADYAARALATGRGASLVREAWAAERAALGGGSALEPIVALHAKRALAGDRASLAALHDLRSQLSLALQHAASSLPPGSAAREIVEQVSRFRPDARANVQVALRDDRLSAKEAQSLRELCDVLTIADGAYDLHALGLRGGSVYRDYLRGLAPEQRFGLRADDPMLSRVAGFSQEMDVGTFVAAAAVHESVRGSAQRELLWTIASVPSFSLLSSADQQAFFSAFTAVDTGELGRWHAAQVVLRTCLRELSPSGQGAMVELLNGLDVMPFHPAVMPGDRAVPFTFSQVDDAIYDVDFADGTRTRITIEENGVTFVDAARALGKLPRFVREYLRELTLSAEWEPGVLASATGSLVRTYFDLVEHPVAMVRDVLAHEVGHVVGFEHFGNLAEDGWDEWRRAGARDGNAVSSYGDVSWHEDIAETLTLYANVRGRAEEKALRAVYPHRFAILDSIFKQ